jgi:hypothetical protein
MNDITPLTVTFYEVSFYKYLNHTGVFVQKYHSQ